MKRADVILPAVFILLLVIMVIALAPYTEQYHKVTPTEPPGHMAALVGEGTLHFFPIYIQSVVALLGALAIRRKLDYGGIATALLMVLAGAVILIGNVLVVIYRTR